MAHTSHHAQEGEASHTHGKPQQNDEKKEIEVKDGWEKHVVVVSSNSSSEPHQVYHNQVHESGHRGSKQQDQTEDEEKTLKRGEDWIEDESKDGSNIWCVNQKGDGKTSIVRTENSPRNTPLRNRPTQSSCVHHFIPQHDPTYLQPNPVAQYCVQHIGHQLTQSESCYHDAQQTDNLPYNYEGEETNDSEQYGEEIEDDGEDGFDGDEEHGEEGEDDSDKHNQNDDQSSKESSESSRDPEQSSQSPTRQIIDICHDLATKTGTQLGLVIHRNGAVYTLSTKRLSPVINNGPALEDVMKTLEEFQIESPILDEHDPVSNIPDSIDGELEEGSTSYDAFSDNLSDPEMSDHDSRQTTRSEDDERMESVDTMTQE